jgi:DAK2 domain fusion protein YloV
VNARDAALELVGGALMAVEAEREIINDLNVYPVPDGDTGTNLALTVRAVSEELEQSPAKNLAAVAAAITKGSLMGARGNSGVILSQIVRGACDVIAAAEHVDATVFRAALREAANAAYRAVKQPVEGTMLTVVREMAAAAQSAPASFGMGELVDLVEDAGRVAVEHTTSQLAALRSAGVVDAGGYGLLVLYRGLSEALPVLQRGGGIGRRHKPAAVTTREPAGGVSELSTFRYCTSLLISGENLVRETLENHLSSLGDSSLVVGNDHMLKIHVHTDDPGAVLSHAVTLGAISEVEINDMHAQTRDRDARLQAARPQDTAVVAVVAGEGNKDLFRALGVAAVVDGGQSMNPSAAQLLEAVAGLVTGEIVLLPNNGNVVLTAEQAAGMSERHIAVVPTTSIPAGLAAMVVFDPQSDALANAQTMDEAIAGVRSAEITYAVRDSELDGIVVNAGQAMGIVDGRLIAAGDDLVDVFARVMTEFASSQPEVVTVLTALNGSAVSAVDLEAAARAACPTAELDFLAGGEPLYPILASCV